MPKIKKTKLKANPNFNSEQLTEEALLNIKCARKVKSISINLNEEFGPLGGVPAIISSLHSAVREMELSSNAKEEQKHIDNLKQVRDTLIIKTYGVNTFNLVENLLFV